MTMSILRPIWKRCSRPERSLPEPGKSRRRVGFVHCVGSRDEKIGNRYCSKVCCATAVKQASEIKQLYPEAETFCFYMDLRMYDLHFEDMYFNAQTLYGVRFVRGRLCEAAEDMEKRVVLKVEDTLADKTLHLSVDMLVLMAGMTAPSDTERVASALGIKRGKDGFFQPEDVYTGRNVSSVPGCVFGRCLHRPQEYSGDGGRCTGCGTGCRRFHSSPSERKMIDFGYSLTKSNRLDLDAADTSLARELTGQERSLLLCIGCRNVYGRVYGWTVYPSQSAPDAVDAPLWSDGRLERAVGTLHGLRQMPDVVPARGGLAQHMGKTGTRPADTLNRKKETVKCRKDSVTPRL